MSFAPPRPLTVLEYAQQAFRWVLEQHELDVNPDMIGVTSHSSKANVYALFYTSVDTKCSALGTYIGNELGGTMLLLTARTPCGTHLYNTEDHFCGVDASSGAPKHVRLQAPQPA